MASVRAILLGYNAEFSTIVNNTIAPSTKDTYNRRFRVLESVYGIMELPITILFSTVTLIF